MHFSNIVPVALSLFASASASVYAVPPTAMRIPMRNAAADPTNPALTWHASNFTLGCSPGGCAYNFNIQGLSSQNTPGFNATCNGTSTQEDYAPCNDKGVLAKINPTPKSENWTLHVEHTWRKPGNAAFYAFGEQNVTSSTKQFKISVKDVYGVA
ncbi:hypothetical protein ASPVEDRAFT_52439 [Aspergillus versicolor CBS 583.65]|uniref:AA1-like domain-containing protein n=1 Tax=Aspergillus versicolor CBS 583.65 TaxID=1036611 RepID=A0A1L9PJ06_ASPVE|nr:uncharacterized protein ASPVEDRAFT_52439 [Aspergillus versicolor CBS 583.65]OJJ01510.1 hypothetical protein ASPVEDRAFT_52439 [Aspergillus versicolor CBS 583.65]